MNRDDLTSQYEIDAFKRRTAETTTRICQICLNPVYDRANASYLEKGGLRLVVHDECLTGMVEAVSKAEQVEREKYELLDALNKLTKKG